tara:strand:- start:348 stop:1496 length:1149 start_codon:yes stop_codon:yes gene_type:complete
MFNFFKNLFRRLFVKKKLIRKKRKQQKKTHYGAHYYLGDLLDNLDYAFKALKNTKKTNKDAYKLFSKIGVSVFNSDFETSYDESSGYFTPDKTPAFGAMAFGPPPKEELQNRDQIAKKAKHSPEEYYWLSVFTFRKIKKMVNVQPSNHQTYLLSLFYQCPKKNQQIPEEIYISLDDQGNLTPLKFCEPTPMRVGKGKKATTFVRMQWRYPYTLVDNCKRRNITIDQAVKNYFWSAVNGSMAQESGISIRVKKGNDALTFAIDMERTPYFFNDREKVINENGNTKPIFHVVKGHFRKNGAFIKTHFRGLRKFKWNGYSVIISLSGLHYMSSFEFTGSAVETNTDHGISPENLVSNKALGLAIENHIEASSSHEEFKKILEENR